MNWEGDSCGEGRQYWNRDEPATKLDTIYNVGLSHLVLRGRGNGGISFHVLGHEKFYHGVTGAPQVDNPKEVATWFLCFQMVSQSMGSVNWGNIQNCASYSPKVFSCILALGGCHQHDCYQIGGWCICPRIGIHLLSLSDGAAVREEEGRHE